MFSTAHDLTALLFLLTTPYLVSSAGLPGFTWPTEHASLRHHQSSGDAAGSSALGFAAPGNAAGSSRANPSSAPDAFSSPAPYGSPPPGPTSDDSFLCSDDGYSAPASVSFSADGSSFGQTNPSVTGIGTPYSTLRTTTITQKTVTDPNLPASPLHSIPSHSDANLGPSSTAPTATTAHTSSATGSEVAVTGDPLPTKAAKSTFITYVTEYVTVQPSQEVPTPAVSSSSTPSMCEEQPYPYPSSKDTALPEPSTVGENNTEPSPHTRSITSGTSSSAPSGTGITSIPPVYDTASITPPSLKIPLHPTTKASYSTVTVPAEGYSAPSSQAQNQAQDNLRGLDLKKAEELQTLPRPHGVAYMSRWKRTEAAVTWNAPNSTAYAD